MNPRQKKGFTVRDRLPRKKLAKRAFEAKFAKKQSKESKILLQEEAGFLEADDGEETWNVKQIEIKNEVDLLSASKSFELSLKQFGPYRLSYLRNGRHLLIGGKMGHVACLDWVTKKLLCEMNVMESIHDVSWLHQETMFAVAQKDWVYMYDNQGVELHCVKQLYRTLKTEFLPYHFLLAASNDRGYLNWLDVSVGKLVGSTQTHLGRLNVMCQNPNNATIVLGHAKGTVTMWAPCVKKPLLSMLTHTAPITDVTIDQSGNYMATSGSDRQFRIWDLRTHKCLKACRIYQSASKITFSQRNLLALSINDTVQIYKDCCTKDSVSPYMSHRVGNVVVDLEFCPFEDVLGVGHQGGFCSALIPGAGEPNFDALESNPFQTKSQRREAEVKSLLEKIQPEMISLNSSTINTIAMKGQKKDEKQDIEYVPPKRDRSIKQKKILKEENRQKRVRVYVEENELPQEDNKIVKYDALSRFKK